MPSNIGAQLVKSLSFEVEAIPQDNAVELKKTTNMTPVNVKVRVRKKDDLMRKGILSVPRNDQPDRPIEKLRLASSDQTIMSFNMVLEADLEEKVAKKSKKHFFGICLGGQDDDDDAQYLPNTDQDSRSDTGVMKLRNVRPVAKPVADDAISSNSSRKKDKIFGKCKPGGCLDPPFGEDKYPYQPHPLRSKTPATTIDDAQALDLQKQTSDITTDKIALKKKTQRTELASEKAANEQNQDKSILSLYQGESGAAIKENDSESIITYPTGISSSGLLLTDEKNEKHVARRTSGARNSRKSFNEFSSNEYFSPTRASRDSSRSDREKNNLTKELLPPRDTTAVSPTRFRHSVEKSGSKDLEVIGSDNATSGHKVKTHNANNKTGTSAITNDALVHKPVLRTTSEGLISELFSDLENDSDMKTWNKTAAAAGIAGAAAAGLVGIGLVANAKKENRTPEERKENLLTEDIKSKGIDDQHPKTGLELTQKTSDDLNKIPVERTLVDNSANQSGIVGSKSITNSSGNKTAAAAGIAGAATAGLVGFGLVANAKKGNITPEERKEYLLTEDIKSKGIDDQHSNTGLEFTQKTSDDTNKIPLERTLVDNSAIQSGMVGSKSITNNFENYGEAVTQGDHLSKGTEISGRPIKNITSVESQTQDNNLSVRGLETTENIQRNLSHTGKSINQSTGGQLASTGMEIIGDSHRNFSPLKHQMQDDVNENRMSTDIYDDRVSGSLPESSTKSNEIDISSKKGFPPVRSVISSGLEQGIANNGKTIEQIADTESRGITTTFGPESEFQHTEKKTSNGISDVFASSGLTTRVGSDTGYSQKSGENRKGSEGKISSGYEEAFSPVRRVMSDGMERSPESRGSERGFPNIKSTSTVKTSHETDEGPLQDFVPNEIILSEGTQDILGSTITNTGTTILEAPIIREGPRSKESIRSRASYTGSYRKISEDDENVLLHLNQGTDEVKNNVSTNNIRESFERHMPLKEARMTNDDQGKSRPETNDASVASDIIKSPSDIILKYRENKTLNQSPVVGVDIQPTENTLEQAGRKLDDWGKWESEGNEVGQFSSSVLVSPHDTSGKYRENTDSVSKEYGKTDKTGMSHSRESIFLNLAFQTYLDENQTAVRTLDSSQDQDVNDVVLVKSLLRAQDKKGISIPLNSKNVMNIVIKSAPPVQKHKSRPPKSISKFDSGKSDYSNSTISLLNIGSDPHAALSSIFHQELVPLQSIIKSLKDEIDSLAAQQMMLRNRLELGTTRSKPFVSKKCCCPKKALYKN